MTPFRSLLIWSSVCASPLTGSAVVRAQESPPPPVGRVVTPQIVAVPDSGTLVFAMLEPHGVLDDDAAEAGIARVVAACRCARARAAVPGVRQSGSQVRDRSAVHFATVRPSEWRAGVAFLQALVRDDVDAGSPTTDAIELEIARAALVADDAEWLYPGSMLQSRARRAFAAGATGDRGLHGSAAALQNVTAARVLALLPWRGGVTYRVFGELPAGVRPLDLTVTVPPSATPGRSFADVVGAATRTPSRAEHATEPERIPHSRVDGPFAAVAFAVPRELRGAALAVLVEVARERALARTPAVIRGAHVKARAPFVAWSWADHEPVLVLLRRAHTGHAEDKAFAAIEQLLRDLGDRPPSGKELARARDVIVSENAPLPWNSTAVVAPGRVLVAMRAAAAGIDAAAVAAVTAADAHAAFAAVTAAGKPYRAVLLPTVQRDPFRRVR